MATLSQNLPPKNLESKSLLLFINFTPKASHICLKSIGRKLQHPQQPGALRSSHGVIATPRLHRDFHHGVQLDSGIGHSNSREDEQCSDYFLACSQGMRMAWIYMVSGVMTLCVDCAHNVQDPCLARCPTCWCCGPSAHSKRSSQSCKTSVVRTQQGSLSWTHTPRL